MDLFYYSLFVKNLYCFLILQCGYTAHRDLKAAQNILAIAMDGCKECIEEEGSYAIHAIQELLVLSILKIESKKIFLYLGIDDVQI